MYTKETKGKNKDTSTDIMAPLDAGTVILTEESDHAPFDIFLMHRHRNQSFMGEAFVFPGGRLDGADGDPALLAYAEGLSLEKAQEKLNEPDLAATIAFGLFFTAVRETFEKSRILLARPDTGASIGLMGENEFDRLESYRKQIHDVKLSLGDLAKKE